MPRTNPYRMNAARWQRHMTHSGCGKCLRAARMAKTDTIVDGTDTATRTITDKDEREHTATVTRRKGDDGAALEA